MPPRTHITAHQLDRDQDLLTELRILSSLRPQDRISTNHAVKPVVRIQKPDFMRSMWRFFGSESRASNVAYVQSLLQRVIDRYTYAIQNGDTALQARICEETESAIQGVRRLQQTYEDDAQFQAAVNIAIDTVCIHLGLDACTPSPLPPIPIPIPKVEKTTDATIMPSANVSLGEWRRKEVDARDHSPFGLTTPACTSSSGACGEGVIATKGGCSDEISEDDDDRSVIETF